MLLVHYCGPPKSTEQYTYIKPSATAVLSASPLAIRQANKGLLFIADRPL
jgi:hypothetical protein